MQQGFKTVNGKIDILDEKVNILDERVGKLESGQIRLENKIDALDERVGNLEKGQICLENKLEDNSKALFDGYSQTYGKLADIEKEVKNLSNKVEEQDMEISVIKGGAK